MQDKERLDGAEHEGILSRWCWFPVSSNGAVDWKGYASLRAEKICAFHKPRLSNLYTNSLLKWYVCYFMKVTVFIEHPLCLWYNLTALGSKYSYGWIIIRIVNRSESHYIKSFKSNLFCIDLFCVCVCVWRMCAVVCVCVHQRTTCRNQFSSSVS